MSTHEQALTHIDQAATTSIGRRILIRTIAIGVVPLLLLGLVVVVGLNGLNSTASTRADESRELLSNESVAVASEEQAVSVSREINLLLNERIGDARAWARSVEVVNAAVDGGEFADEAGLVGRSIDVLEEEFADSKQLRSDTGSRNFLRSEIEANPDFREIFFTDLNGFNVAYTDQTSDFVQSDEEWWTDAWANGLSVSDVDYDDSAGVFSVDISVRIDQPGTNRPVGVLKTSLSIAFVQQFAGVRANDSVEYLVALADGRLIADSSSNHAPLRMMSLNFAGAAASPGLGTAMTAGLEPGEAGVQVTDDFVYGYTTTLDPTAFDEVGVDDFAGFDWLVVSTQTSDVAFAPLRGIEALKADIGDAGNNLRTLIMLLLLAGVAVAYLMARRTAEGIVRPIHQLTAAATAAAETGLPTAVDEINAEGADLESVTAPSVDIATGDELQTLAGAFNSVQATAVRLAAEQASSRRNTAEMFVNLGRRNQSLLKRQLRFIDSLEQSEENPDTLESLFKLDHLATRMRRNAESLLVLAGDRSPRRWAAPVEVRTAVESALAEVESYERVDLSGIADGEMLGNAVADVAHILAEVIENGLNFSPPTAQVAVTGRLADDEYILTVTDEGFGMKQDEIEVANERLSTVTELTKVPSQYLGLFVVARLAQRHGITVSLSDAPAGGLSVRIVLPAPILHREIVEEQTPMSDSPAAALEALDLAADITLDEDPEVAQAEAEVFALLAKAEEALAKVDEIRAQRSDADIAEEEKAKAARSGRENSSDRADGSTQKARRSEDRTAAAADPAPATAETPESAVEMNPEPVDVGGMQFTRREKKTSGPDSTANQGRRSSDSAPNESAADDPAVDADLAKFGFTRRESKRSNASTATESVAARAVSTVAEQAEDVEVVAEKSRNQWTSFQRGKQDAESTTNNPNREQ